MSEPEKNNPGIPEALQELGKAAAGEGISIVRYRNFLGNRVARRFMDRVGLHLADDDVGNAALAELLGTAVTNGIVLGMRGTTTPEDIEVTAAELSDQLPIELHSTFGAIMPHMIAEGVIFHRDELLPGSDEVAEWKTEFQQLQAADPLHASWTGELADGQPGL